MRELEPPSLLHHFLEHSALHLRNATAIVDRGESVTFGQLLQQSRDLANTLRERGMRKGDRVALIMPKSAKAIISLFATLFNGGIYVPLDTRWPPERIKTTLGDCAPRFVILDCSEALLTRIHSLLFKSSEISSVPMIVDTAGGCMRWHEAANSAGNAFSEPGIELDDPALILFTSGSTGRPKGVTLSHRAVAAFVRWAADQLEITVRDRLACPSPLSFDLSTLDIYAMALRGAACVIVPEELAWMPRFLAQFAAEQKISVWYSVPSLLSAMLLDDGLSQYRFPALRVVAFAGEVFPSQYLERLRAIVPGADFYNLYGPTETNVVTWYHVPNDFDFSRPIPIGCPCPYAELILDPADEEDAGQTVARHLLVAGESVMLGYWNRPEETEKAFVEIPNLQGGRRRFYRTGDRVLEDAASGNYIFVGRKDRQVKRRGYRVELGEIERVLSGHPRILEVAVTSAQDSRQQAFITAFVRFVPDTPVSQVELRIHGARSLPSYMMPDQIIPVQFIPKGSRGKIDYEALGKLLRRS